MNPGRVAVATAHDPAHGDAIGRVLDQMRCQLAEPLTLDQLAATAIMSKSHFLRTFGELTGVSPKRFLTALRIEAAKRQLLDGDRSIFDVCMDVGFSSLGTFTRRFTELVGLSPGRFRQLGQAFFPEVAALMEVAASCPLPPDRPRLGAVVRRMSPDQIVFAGLFDTPVPQSRPLSCAVLLRDQDRFELAAYGSDQGYLFAAAMAEDADPMDLLVGGSSIKAVASSGPLKMGSGAGPWKTQRLELRPPNPFDPPMLLTLPLLLHERVAADLEASLVTDDGSAVPL